MSKKYNIQEFQKTLEKIASEFVLNLGSDFDIWIQRFPLQRVEEFDVTDDVKAFYVVDRYLSSKELNPFQKVEVMARFFQIVGENNAEKE